jgi:hypothetical protein
MARSSQTFKKRQRENKLREKAQMKRERRQQRRMERKTPPMVGGVSYGVGLGPDTEEVTDPDELDVSEDA